MKCWPDSAPSPAPVPIEIYEQQRAGASLKPLLERGVPENAARAIGKQLAFRVEDRSASALEAGEAIADALLDPGRYFWSRRHTMAAMGTGAVAALSGGAWWWIPDQLAERGRTRDRAAHPVRTSGAGIPGHRDHRESRRFTIPPVRDYEALRIISTESGRLLPRAELGAGRGRESAGVGDSRFEAAAEEGETYVNLHAQDAPVRYSVDITSILEVRTSPGCARRSIPRSKGSNCRSPAARRPAPVTCLLDAPAFDRGRTLGGRRQDVFRLSGPDAISISTRT